MADVAQLRRASRTRRSRAWSTTARRSGRRPGRASSPRCASSTTGPTRSARALVTGRSRTLGVVSFDTTLYGPASTLFAIERAAHAARLLHHRREPRRAGPRLAAGAVERLRRQGVDGILVITPQDRGRCEALAELPAGVPSSRSRPGPSALAGGRGRPGGRRARARGFCSISATATVWHSPARASCSRPSSASRAGARRSRRPAPRAAGRCPATGAPAGLRARARSSPPTPESPPSSSANDQMALGLLRALHEAGRACPGDVSVVGFDDIPEAQYFTRR